MILMFGVPVRASKSNIKPTIYLTVERRFAYHDIDNQNGNVTERASPGTKIRE